MAIFLVVAALTGSLLAWFEELEALISPELHLSQAPYPDAHLLDPLLLREKLLAHYPGTEVQGVPLAIKPGRSVSFFIEAAPDAHGNVAELADDQIFLNPYTGAVQGSRRSGDITQGKKNLMVFVYRLHYALALDTLGTWLMGIVALIWTLDCFVGAYLTFPLRRSRTSHHRSWWQRWWPAWKLRWRSSGYKLNFDLHRASGLWLWAMLFVLAWSSVGFNLPQVYKPAMRVLFEHQVDMDSIAPLATPQRVPRIAWEPARDIGRALMAEQAARHGFVILREDWLTYDATRALYRYDVRSSLDLAERSGQTRLGFDANSGAFKNLWLPTGGANGDTVDTWLAALHMAALWGVSMKIFVCVMGLITTLLTVTGVVIWMRKRRARA